MQDHDIIVGLLGGVHIAGDLRRAHRFLLYGIIATLIIILLDFLLNDLLLVMFDELVGLDGVLSDFYTNF